MPDVTLDRTTYIQFDDDEPISSGIFEGSMRFDKILYSEEMAFGVISSSLFEVTLYGISDVSGSVIHVYQMDNGIRKDLFTGKVNSAKLDSDGQYRDIIAYDEFYYKSRKNVADWYNNLFLSKDNYTTYELFISLLTYCSFEPGNTVDSSLFVGTVSKNSTVEFEKISFKDMVRFITEFSGIIPYINGSGEVDVWCPSIADSVDISSEIDKNESIFEDYTVGKITQVELLGVDENPIASIDYENGGNRIYKLKYNPLMLDVYGEDAEQIQAAIFSKFKQNVADDLVQYVPCNVKMIVSDLSIPIGAVCETAKGYFYVSENAIYGPLLVEQDLNCTAPQIQEEVEEDYDPKFSYLNTKIDETAEDLQNQIDNFQPSDEFLEQVGVFNETIANASGLRVITYKNTQDGTVTRYFYAPAENATSIAGSKFVFTMKSTGFAWTNNWQGTADASSEGATVWQSGLTADGNMILKMLTAYKISADIVTTGTLQSANGDVSIDLDNKEVDFGSDLHYDQTNGLQIASTVLIGAAGEAVADVLDAQIVEYAEGTSGTVAPTGDVWNETIPTVASGNYLWTRTTTAYVDSQDVPQTVVSYSVARQGENGTNGNDGRGIYSVQQKYTATNSTSIPSTGFTDLATALQSFSATNKYLWSRTETKYTDNPTQAELRTFICAVWGDTGSQGNSGRGVSSIVHQYYLSTSNTTQTGGSWSETPATYITGRYYWERDQITWTNPSGTTYTTAVLSNGLNKAILDVNTLNTDFAQVIIKENNKTLINGANIYTGSVTTDAIAAYEALIKNLMANKVDVTGDITVQTSTDSQVTTDQKNAAAALIFGEGTTYSSLPVTKRVIAAYFARSKLIVKSADSDWYSCLLPEGVYCYNKSSDSVALYYATGFAAPTGGTTGDFLVGGDLTVNGTINGGGGGSANIKTGTQTFQTNAYGNPESQNVTITFDESFSSKPKVFLTLRGNSDYYTNEFADHGTVVVPTQISTSGFTAHIEHLPTSFPSFSARVDWLAIE